MLLTLQRLPITVKLGQHAPGGRSAFDAPLGHVERDNDGGSRSRIRSIVSRIMELRALAPLEVRYSRTAWVSTSSAVSEIIRTAAHANPFCRATWASAAVSMSTHTAFARRGDDGADPVVTIERDRSQVRDQ